MIVDSSALLAIILGEPDAAAYGHALADARRCRMSAANWLEAAMVVDGRADPVLAQRFTDLIEASEIELVALTPQHAEVARNAWRRFGRGKHPARLNFGDCMAYALALSAREPLLFKGNDFSHTDVVPALQGA